MRCSLSSYDWQAERDKDERVIGTIKSTASRAEIAVDGKYWATHPGLCLGTIRFAWSLLLDFLALGPAQNSKARSRSPEAIYRNVVEQVQKWQGLLKQHDDITLVVAKVE